MVTKQWTVLIVLIATLVATPSHAAVKVASTVTDHEQAQELFSVPTEATERKQSIRHYTPYRLITATNPKIKYDTSTGRLTRVGYQLPPSFTPEHLIENYRSRIKALNGKIRFQCADKDCGSKARLNKFIKALHHIPNSQPQLLVAEIELATKRVLVQIYVAGRETNTALQIDQLELLDQVPLLLRANSDYLNSHVSEVVVADQSHKDLKGSADHPMLTRIPAAYIRQYEQYQFGQTPVLTSIKEKDLNTEQLEGRITDILYELPRTYSEYEIHKNYQKALTELGFVEQIHCHGSDCPNSRTMLKQIKLLNNNGFDEHQYYSLYVLNRAVGDIHVMSYVIGFTGNLISEIRIIEEATLVDDRIAIDLQSLTRKIAQSGHVALDGLLFQFDSDKMLAEADEVITVVANYLKANPKMGFYVVGHTDDQGAQRYNQNLSQQRANAVLKRLVTEHNINEKQVIPIGVGEHAPVANNATNQGKKLNRRVELVLRSDGR